MAESEQKSNGNLGAILGGIAAIITAVATLLAIFYGPKHGEVPPPVAAAQPNKETPPPAAPSPKPAERTQDPPARPATRTAPQTPASDDTAPRYADISEILGPWHFYRGVPLTINLSMEGGIFHGYLDNACADGNNQLKFDFVVFHKNILEFSTTDPKNKSVIISSYMYKNQRFVGGNLGTPPDQQGTVVRGVAICGQ